jgi:alpha-mannosidase
MDLSQTDFGVSILNDGKYGGSVHQNVMALSLIKAGIFPDFLCDEGKHEFTYSIYVHPGDDLRDVVREAEELNRPLLAVSGRLNIPSSFLEVSPQNFKLTSLRKVKGKIVIRLVEIFGTSGKLSIKIPWEGKIYLTNLLEEERKEVSFPLSYRPFKIYTFVVE